MRIRSAGRGRLPVWVVRNPSVLRGIAIAGRCYHTGHSGRGRPLPGRAELAFDLGDPFLVALVKGPLLDPLGAHQPRLRQDPQVLTRGRLAHAELGRDEHTAHAVAHEIAVDLTAKVDARRL